MDKRSILADAHDRQIHKLRVQFCCFCSRLRLTAIGKLRACIMSEAGINLRHVPKERYPEILKSVLRMKPVDRIEHIQQPMYQIGG